MGYDDRFYYGQGKVKVKIADNDGKSISLHSSNNRYYTNTIEDGECNFTVPGTDYYDITLVDGSTSTHKGSVSVSYGETKIITIGE